MIMILLRGTRQGIEWSVTVYKSFFSNAYHAIAIVGTTHKATETFLIPEDAKEAGCQLLANTFAELEDIDHA